MQAFESSALFESGLSFGLTNFEHVVTHLERAREKINHHLKSEDQFLLKVSEIFPRISSVRLVLSHLFDDTTILRQLSHFDHIHTLVLEQPVGGLDWNLREFLLEKGHRLAKLSLRVHSASLLDLVWIFRSCPRLKIFRFFAMVLDSALGELHPQWPSQYLTSTEEEGEEEEGVRLADLAELCMGCAKTFHVDQQQEQDANGQEQQQAGQPVDNNNNLNANADDAEDNAAAADIFLDLFVSLLLQARRLRSLVLSGACSKWASDQTVGALIEAGALTYLRRMVITSKVCIRD